MDKLDALIEEIMDLARENPIDDARIYIKDRIEKDVIKPYVVALKKAKQTIQSWHGIGFRDKEAEALAWELYDRNAPEMKAINAAIGTTELTADV